MEEKIPIIAIVGPTATGKTRLSIEVAKRFNAEIISVDSMQIYKEFNICTAKPTYDELNTVKHYLIDEISVKENFSVFDYVNKARIYAEKINKSGKIPIIVGGTGLYFDSFLNNVDFEQNQIDKDILDKLIQRANKDKQGLYFELEKVDPISAEKIHINNVKRVIRALAFYYSFGYPISAQGGRSKNQTPLYKALILGLNFQNRKILNEKINKRVDEMVKDGLIDEVQRVSKLDVGQTASEAIGYKEILPYLKRDIDLDSAIESVKKNTRLYAKRQMTWFKRNKDIKWILIDDYDSFDEVEYKAFQIIKENGFNEVF